MELYEKIKKVRKSKGMSQTFVADKVEMKVSNYNMKENGKRPITTGELEKIAAAVGVSVSFLFDENINVELNNAG